MIVTDKSILRIPSEPVSDTREGGEIARKLSAALRRHNKWAHKTGAGLIGVGLAAPQIGIHKQVCIIHVGDCPIVLMNPIIVAQSEAQISHMEGCLSLPGVEVEKLRHVWVRIRTINLLDDIVLGPVTHAEWGHPRILMRSIVAQHEIEHLCGLLITDFAGPDAAPKGSESLSKTDSGVLS